MKAQIRRYTILTRLLMTSFVVMISLSAFADGGGAGNTGGGDPCEARIQFIRDDILAWINMGKPTKLSLPGNLAVSDYSTRMSNYLKVNKDQNGNTHEFTFIECAHHPVKIQGEEKVCRFDRYDQKIKGPKITCDYNSFMNAQTTDVDEQYRLIHHEFAGLAQLENPDGPKSEYPISNQIAALLQYQVVKKLAVEQVDATTDEGIAVTVTSCVLQSFNFPQDFPKGDVDLVFQKTFDIIVNYGTDTCGDGDTLSCPVFITEKSSDFNYMKNGRYIGEQFWRHTPKPNGHGTLAIKRGDGGAVTTYNFHYAGPGKTIAEASEDSTYELAGIKEKGTFKATYLCTEAQND